MTNIISHQQLASYVGTPNLSTEVTATTLALANQMVFEVIGDLTPVPARAVAIALEVAARPVRAADYDSVTTTSDGTSKTVRRERRNTAAELAQGVYVSPNEREELEALVTGRGVAGGAFTIRPGARR